MMHWYPFIGIGLFLMIMAIIVAYLMGTFFLIIAVAAMKSNGPILADNRNSSRLILFTS